MDEMFDGLKVKKVEEDNHHEKYEDNQNVQYEDNHYFDSRKVDD